MAGLVNLTTLSANFKNKYGKLSDDTFDSTNVLSARAKVVSDFVGSTYIDAIPLGFAGSVGVGTLPEANAEPLSNASFSAKKVYGRMKIDREALYASKGDEGAFVELLSHQTAATVKSYSRLGEFFWMGNGDGVLGTLKSSGAVVTNTDPIFVLQVATSFLEANFEEKDYVNIGTSNTDTFEITSVDPTNQRITVTRLGGAKVPANSDPVYIQGGSSGTNSPLGLKKVCQATSSTLYGITVGRRWQSYQNLSVGTGLTVDLMNQSVLELRRRCGQNPKFILTSFTQYRKYMNLMEDQKRYDLTTIYGRRRDLGPDLTGVAAFSGLQYLTTTGPIPVLESRFCDADTMYFLNDDYIKQVRRKGFGWFEDDGTVILRMADSDAYEARYGGYYENYIMPSFQAVITGLST